MGKIEGQSRRAVFADRDGTLNTEIGYLHRLSDFEWIPGVKESICRLKESGFLVIVITNQAGIAHGYYTSEDVERLHQHMQNDLKEHGCTIDAFYFSPYHPNAVVEAFRADHPTRKPRTGLLEKAVSDFDVDVSRSYMVGDKASDVAAGSAFGLATIRVRTGYGRDVIQDTIADHTVDSFGDAAELIVRSADKI